MVAYHLNPSQTVQALYEIETARITRDLGHKNSEKEKEQLINRTYKQNKPDIVAEKNLGGVGKEEHHPPEVLVL